jgi:hypothetical protein
MRVVLGFENFDGFGGTETYTVTVARELDRLGHDALIYSPNRGAMAEVAREQGVPVLSREELPSSRDLVIAQDAATCHELAARYLDAVVMMVVHSADYVLQAPPQLEDRCQAVVVLNDRVRRAVEARAWHPPIVRLRQPIELGRYWDLGPARPQPQRALVTSNYVKGPRAELIERACRANGLEVDWIGATTNSTASPEMAVADADIVIGLGRSALEAMAGGRATLVYGISGGDGWVTPERYPDMEADGFAGTSLPDLEIDGDRLAAELGNWRPEMGSANHDLAVAHHGARDHVTALLDHAGTLASSPPRAPTLSDEMAHLVRLQWRAELRAMGSLAEATRLRALVAEREQEAEELRRRLVAAWEDMELFRRTRRFRLASRIAAPLDRLRNGRGSGD